MPRFRFPISGTRNGCPVPGVAFICRQRGVCPSSAASGFGLTSRPASVRGCECRSRAVSRATPDAAHGSRSFSAIRSAPVRPFPPGNGKARTARFPAKNAGATGFGNSPGGLGRREGRSGWISDLPNRLLLTTKSSLRRILLTWRYRLAPSLWRLGVACSIERKPFDQFRKRCPSRVFTFASRRIDR